jgi:hypothetical protein
VKQEGQDVLGVMESPYRGRVYLGKRRRVKLEFSSFFFDPSESQG